MLLRHQNVTEGGASRLIDNQATPYRGARIILRRGADKSSALLLYHKFEEEDDELVLSLV